MEWEPYRVIPITSTKCLTKHNSFRRHFTVLSLDNGSTVTHRNLNSEHINNVGHQQSINQQDKITRNFSDSSWLQEHDIYSNAWDGRIMYNTEEVLTLQSDIMCSMHVFKRNKDNETK